VLIRQLHIGVAAPESERFAQEPDRALEVARGQRLAALRSQRLEAPRVGFLGVQEVARCARDQHPVGTRVAERLAQAGHIDVEAL
jgi:hypothetical protein